MPTMTAADARTAMEEALHRVVPDADLDSIGPDVDLVDEFELDSLDVLAFVENLSTRVGRSIDEDDYPRLRTRASIIDYLTT